MGAASYTLTLALSALFLSNTPIGGGFPVLGSVTIPEILALGSLILMLLAFAQGRSIASGVKAENAMFVFCLLFAFITIDLLGAALNEKGEAAVYEAIKYRLAGAIFFLLPVLLIRDANDGALFMRGIFVASLCITISILLSGFGVMDFSRLGGRINYSDRISLFGVLVPRTSGIISDFGNIALVIGFLCAHLVVGGKIKRRGRQRAVAHLFGLSVLAVLISLSVILTGSRNGLITALAVISSVFASRFSVSRVGSLEKWIVGVFVLCGLSLLGVVFGHSVYDSLVSFRVESSGARLDQYSYAIKSIISAPLIGHGQSGCFVDGLPIHNFILAIGCRSGLLGMGIVIFGIAVLGVSALSCLRGGGRSLDQERQDRALLLFGFFVAFIVSSSFYAAGATSGNQIFWAFGGVLTACILQERNAGKCLAYKRYDSARSGATV